MKTRLTRAAALLLLVAVLLSLLCACAGDPTPLPGPNDGPGEEPGEEPGKEPEPPAEPEPLPPAKSSYTYAEIAARLTQSAWQADPATLHERAYQVSSCAKEARYNEETGLYESWDANGDTNYVTDAQGNRVLLDVSGAGYVSRLWFAAIKRGGRITVQVDGHTIGEDDLLHYMTGHVSTDYGNDGAIVALSETACASAHEYPRLSYMSSKGYNSFLPITFSESVRILCSPDSFDYYQANYTLFPDGTVVEPLAGFGENMQEDATDALVDANETLTFGTLPFDAQTLALLPGERVTLYESDTPGAFTKFALSIPEKTGADLTRALRDAYIEIYWDGNDFPSVSLSLGDFFGVPAGTAAYQTVSLGATKDGVLYNRFYMPYEKAKIVIGTKEALSCRLDVTIEPLDAETAAGTLRFTALWQAGEDRPFSSDRWPDVDLLSLSGRGRLVGQMWHTWQRLSEFWWGEGDERFFVNGEKSPVWCGTGCEDQIGYAYAIPSSIAFSSPYRAHPVGAGASGSAGDKVNLSLFAAASLPFTDGMVAAVEKYMDDRYCYLSAVSYAYLDPASLAANAPEPYDEAARNAVAPLSPDDDPIAAFDRYEGEHLVNRLTYTTGKVYAQSLGDRFSGNRQFCWYGVANGELSFPISVAADGRYQLAACLTKASDFAIFDLYLDGEPLATGIDLYAAALTSERYDFGIRALTAGEHTVTVRTNGKNAACNAGTLVFGLDWFSCVPEGTLLIESGDMIRMGVTTTGSTLVQTYDNSSIAGIECLTFINNSPDTVVSLPFTVDSDGDYTLTVLHPMAGDYATVTVFVDGEQIGGPADLFRGGFKIGEPVTYGTVHLSAGTHTLVFKPLDKNARSRGYVFSIDRILFVRNADE